MIKIKQIDEMLHDIREKLGRIRPTTDEEMKERSLDAARKYGLTVVKKPAAIEARKAGELSLKRP